MRRIEPADGILLAAVAIWSLNFTASKYVLGEGFQPLAYAGLRYGIGATLLALFTLARERSLRIARRDLVTLVLPAAGMLLINQLSFVYALKLTNASTVALILGLVPVFMVLLAWGAGLERPGRTFWPAAVLSVCGVVLVAIGSGSVSGNVLGLLLAVVMPATWAAYSVLVMPLMRRYSPWRISSLIMLLLAAALLVIASPQLADQSYLFGALTWAAFAYSIAGPVIAAPILWFTAVDRVGAARASLFANLQPFAGVAFAILLLSESLTRLELVGGALIAAGIVLERRDRAATMVQPSGE